MSRDAGSAAPMVLAVLILLAAALSGLAALVPASLSYERRSRAAEAERVRLDRAVEAVLAALSEDPTPETDSPDDPVWGLAAAGAEGVRVELEDVSSRLNPNLVRKKLLSETSLKNLLLPGAAPEALQQYREDEGLSTDPDHYRDFFAPDSRQHLTGYGWANVNTTDEFVLRSLCRSLSGSDSKAEAFHGRIQAALSSGTIVSEADLPGFLGPDASLLEPVVSAAPSWNVHFLDPFLLGEVLAYPAYNIQDPSAKAAALLSERSSGPLTEARIAALLGVEKNHVLTHYLGARTWFWEIRARAAGSKLTVVAARDPRADRVGGKGLPRFLVIERRYEK